MFSEKEMISTIIQFHKDFCAGTGTDDLRDRWIDTQIKSWAKNKAKENPLAGKKKDDTIMRQFICTKCGKVVESPTLNPPKKHHCQDNPDEKCDFVTVSSREIMGILNTIETCAVSDLNSVLKDIKADTIKKYKRYSV